MKSMLLGFIFLSSFSFAAQDLKSINQQFIGDYELVSYVTFSEDGAE